MLLIVILINVHALLSLDRFSVPPFAQHVWCIRSAYLGLVFLCGVGGLLPFVIKYKESHAGLQWMMMVVRLGYVVVSCWAWRLSNADGWTLHFPLGAIGLTCLNNGLLYHQNFTTIVVSAAVFFGCIVSQHQERARISAR